jgi:hypothetical protein
VPVTKRMISIASMGRHAKPIFKYSELNVIVRMDSWGIASLSARKVIAQRCDYSITEAFDLCDLGCDNNGKCVLNTAADVNLGI